ncbi:MAG: nicotinamide-nucleotide adenylyltransferase [Euryarchaeota archaeon]|nr:nicotinamide-nucleotide adenylyltransferase [Euryarchaeota archaeon]
MRRALFIGRFQPFHNGHLKVIADIAKDFDEVVIGIGSAQESHTFKNPFTAGERFHMIAAALDAAGVHNYHIVPIPDVNRNSMWVAQVRSFVPPFQVFFSNNPLATRLFSESGHEVRPAPFVEREKYSGTSVRDAIRIGTAWEALVPSAVASIIKTVDGAERIKELRRSDAAAREGADS